MEKKTIGIIGGGAAGMMAAIAAKEKNPDAEVMLFEKNSYFGAKVAISGGGRCNLTTAFSDVKSVLSNYPRGAKFLTKAMSFFSPRDVMAWFEAHGLRLKVEDNSRVFPLNNEGSSVVEALGKELTKLGVLIHLNSVVKDVVKEGDVFRIIFYGNREVAVDSLILTTGGNVYRQTGSSGDGYAFAKKLGHTITRLAPSLGMLEVAEGSVTDLAGESFPKAELTLSSDDGQKVFKRSGPFLFTHRGVSGPAVFALSALAAYEEIRPEKPMKLTVNFMPDEQPDILKRRFDSIIDANGKKHPLAILDILLPRNLAKHIARSLALDPEIHAARLSKEQRRAMLMKISGFELAVTGRGAGDEFVTAGGVDTNEINPYTMGSKKCPGLFFAGEILDVDGFTGGFNLQSAWCTGRLAGENA